MNTRLRAGFRAAMIMMSSCGMAGTAWAGCTISSSGLAFGAYQPLTFDGRLTSVDKTSTATISISCSGIVTGGSYSIALGPSTVGNSMSPRYLANPQGGPNLAFNVYREGTHSMVWGDGPGVIGGLIPGGDSTQSHTVYGKMPAAQNTLRVGTYSGTLVMTVTYNP